MLRLAKKSFLVLSVLVLCASVSLAQSKGSGGASGRGVGSGGSSGLGGGISKGSGNSILPTASSTKVVATKISVGQLSDPKVSRVVLDPKDGKIVETRVTRVVDTKLTKVVETRVTQVVPTMVTRVVDTRVTQVVPTMVTQVVPTMVTQVVPTMVTQVVPTMVTQVVPTTVTQVVVTRVTRVVPGQVIINPVVGGWGWGDCGCGCGCGWFNQVLSYFGYEAPAVPVQYERYLRLHNDTDEKLTVYLRFHTQDVTGQWDWIPETPGPTATKWMAFELQPNEVLMPKTGDLQIAGNRIRIYAESATRSWKNYKDQDYWLVPEMTPAGEHLYYAPERQTYQFYINLNTK